ncbi:unnamed protein product [Closterium sp. NIES-54]
MFPVSSDDPPQSILSNGDPKSRGGMIVRGNFRWGGGYRADAECSERARQAACTSTTSSASIRNDWHDLIVMSQHDGPCAAANAATSRFLHHDQPVEEPGYQHHEKHLVMVTSRRLHRHQHRNRYQQHGGSPTTTFDFPASPPSLSASPPVLAASPPSPPSLSHSPPFHRAAHRLPPAPAPSTSSGARRSAVRAHERTSAGASSPSATPPCLMRAAAVNVHPPPAPRAVGLRELESQRLPQHMRRESSNPLETPQHDEVSFERAAVQVGVGRQQRRSLLRQWFRDAPDGFVSCSVDLLTQVNADNSLNEVNAVNSLNAVNRVTPVNDSLTPSQTGAKEAESGSRWDLATRAAEQLTTTQSEAEVGEVQGGEVLRRPAEDIRRQWLLLRKEIGRGQYGVIRRCVHRSTGEIAACKSIRKSAIQSGADVEAVRNEVAFMEELEGHPNIIQIKQAAETNRHVHVVMELCEGGDLFDRIDSHGRLSESSAARIFRSLMLALQHCHSHGIVHRDIKPENVLVSNKSPESVKLIDFGVAARMALGFPLSEEVGTAEYMAPEVFSGAYGRECDVWSAGVTLFVMLCGQTPYLRDRPANSSSSCSSGKEGAVAEEGVWRRVLEAKRRGFSHSRRWQELSSPAKHLIIRMLSADPTTRISVDEILEHEWIVASERRIRTWSEPAH